MLRFALFVTLWKKLLYIFSLTVFMLNVKNYGLNLITTFMLPLTSQTSILGLHNEANDTGNLLSQILLIYQGKNTY